MDTIAERVARGAALLDEKRPGWMGEIVPEDLDMGCCYWCVLGQLFGDFLGGCDELDLDGVGQPRSSDGFDVTDINNQKAEYTALTAAWLAEIDARLTFAPEPELEDALAC